MSNKGSDVKARIAESAYELFSKLGYDKTTVEQITAAAGCSIGSFYHYYSSKETLLISWTDNFDAEYKAWHQQVDPDMNSIDKLLALSVLSFGLSEFRSSVASSAAVYIHLLQGKINYSEHTSSRYYTSLIHQIIKEGQLKGEIIDSISYIELGKMIYATHRGAIMEWCLASGTYSIKEFGGKLMGMLLQSFVKTV